MQVYLHIALSFINKPKNKVIQRQQKFLKRNSINICYSNTFLLYLHR